MVKAAVLITGQMRDTHVNYLNHMKHFIEPNDLDVFVVTSTKNFWYSDSNPNQSRDPKNFVFHLHSENSVAHIEATLRHYYGDYLKGFMILENEEIPESTVQPDYYAYFINNQLNNNKKAFKLALKYQEDGRFKYDLFIRLRIDKTVFPKLMILHEKIQLPVTTHSEPTQFFYVGTQNMMQHYCEFTYLENYQYNDDVRMPDPPLELLKHNKSKFSINVIPNTLVIYQLRGNNGLGLIGDFPYILKKQGAIGWNANCLEPQA